MEPLDLALTFKIACSVGKGLKPLEKITQSGGQVLLKIDAMAPNQIAMLGIETGEAQSVTQAACLRAPSLI
ncbi:hypothetical protein FHX09_002971 [Rhizobium sp. BK538]|nr:hypothetical protein [Rhizobium sp. BK060]MBB4169125.1 hypothetical protein [Rhizobium sp. BK538]